MALIVYATPHQDDETLSMGASIRRHIEAGHDVHVLLLTNGINSGARTSTGLDRPRFTDARDDELRRAVRQLGVSALNIHVSRHSTEDGKLAAAAAADALRDFLDRFPGAWVKSYSHLPANGRHADHVAAGQAAVDLLAAGVIANLRLYVEPWLLPAFQSANPGVSLTADRPADTAAVVRALDEYGVVDQPGSKWGIGHLSVPSAFAVVRADPASWYHVPPT